MSDASRRDFLKTGAAATAAATVLTSSARAAKNSANDRLRIVVCGLKGRGERHIDALHEISETENVEIAGLCDVHEGYLNSIADHTEKLTGTRPQLFNDMRKVLDDQTIDAISFATPNHWHALGTVWACQAGKDVYCEKPGTHNLAEGPIVINAARKYDRIVQHGTQCRTSENIREGIQKLQEGIIGKVYMARVTNYKVHPKGLGKHNPGRPPEELNWDMWTGPAPQMAFSNFNWQRYNYRWDTGCGDIGNQGVHQLDMVRWGMKLDRQPDRVQSMGGNIFFTDDDAECPCTLTTAYEWDNGGDKIMVTCETRDGYTNPEAGMGGKYQFVQPNFVCGVIFYGTEGYMIIPDYSSYRTFFGRDREPGPYKAIEGMPMMNAPHFANWVQAIRSRRREDLFAEIREGHLSSSLCHLANVAYRTGRTLDFDGETETVKNDDEANSFLARQEYRAPYQMPVL
ncbi:Gfo/Idh/MocA family protein [Calycomorphotria hydatis]|uniref:Glucose--fructose oxidoreductase n=1 Tax=Calycomorphotria hydatis TaxID=2528027 RepID=A0A517T3Y6_9PLAN|nr:Gfo/Idh/MocA family oxidoreductase [Calycomorphotria hydatis]QDT63061.1 Glucose--fructose oxidoreductase precursor [Calycomorphotria hydatis]